VTARFGLGGMDTLSVEGIQAGLGTGLVGQNVVYLPETGSTNDEARRLAEAGAPEGTLVITDHQTAGRGRLSRRWEAPPGCCLLMSLVFRPELAPHQIQRLTMICGLALVGAIESGTGLAVGLKWPNDAVLGDGAKVAGILTEIGLSVSRVDYVVVGIGLNVNLDPDRLPGDLLAPATSLSRALGRPVARLPLLQGFLRAVEGRYLALKAGRSPHAEWAEKLVTLGKQVRVSGAGRVLSGVAEGVDADGALLVRLQDGCLEAVLAGDVTLRP
jgi:BirA family biotin operon repressor/biotin-[acetyl-CoA-carboxylase] ligase